MPVLQPAELWQRSGRYSIPELFKLKDRKGTDLVLAMTHEEAVTSHVAQVVRSYRDLPFSLYHFQVKERDEPRPRAGLLRTREFIMKDAYTFDRTREGLDEHYERYREAYDRVMDRCGLEWYRVESDVGMMGGVGAHEYMAPSPAGENDVALAPGYAANVEVASADPKPVELPPGIDAPEIVETPGLVTVADVCGRMDVPAGALLKAFPVMVEDRGPAAGDGPRRPPRQRDQAPERARGGVPGRARRRVRRAHRPRRLHRPGRRERADPARRRRRAGLLHHRRQPRERAPARRRARPRLPVQARRRAHGRGRRHRRRPRDPDRARDRGRQHLQARHALLRAARRDLPRRERQVAADLDGLLRPRPRTPRGGRRRAVRRRERHLLAARDGAVRRASRRAGPRGQRGARAGRAASTASCARPGWTSSTTTATPGRGRSSPTRSCSGSRSG